VRERAPSRLRFNFAEIDHDRSGETLQHSAEARTRTAAVMTSAARDVVHDRRESRASRDGATAPVSREHGEWYVHEVTHRAGIWDGRGSTDLAMT
jgi:hypothetical protein